MQYLRIFSKFRCQFFEQLHIRVCVCMCTVKGNGKALWVWFISLTITMESKNSIARCTLCAFRILSALSFLFLSDAFVPFLPVRFTSSGIPCFFYLTLTDNVFVQDEDNGLQWTLMDSPSR